MKSRNKIIYILGALVLLATGCNDKLIEHPYTVFNIDYFKTSAGIQNGVNALYSGMRYNFGPEGSVGIAVDGTDEWTYSEQVRNGAGGTADYLTLGNYTLDNANGALLTPWNRNYSNINLANLIVELAPGVTFSSSSVATDSTTRNVILGEARYLRALYYMLLVQQFGAVPVDLGSGDLKSNQNPFQGFNRLPLADIFAKDYKAIIDDLKFASQNLPDKRPVGAFKLSKAAAYHLLAKAYIHRGYSAAKQTDDFQNAYNAATEVINNQSKYGVALLSAYSDVHKVGNDYNAEILYSVERIPGNNTANEVGNPNGIGGGKGVDAGNDFCPDYTSIKAPLVSSSTAPCGTRSVLYGRPIKRFCPTPWLYYTAFQDKDNDSRFDGSFRTVWLATQAGGGFAIGDTGFILAKTNHIADSINALAVKKAFRVIAPREFYLIEGSLSQNIYPHLNKYDDPNKLAFNDEAGRPFVVSKFSEMYLLAAEAALQAGHPADAVTLINVLKLRAANRINLSSVDVKDIVKKYGAAAVTGTSLSSAEVSRRYDLIKVTDVSQITLDFILDERTRELCGESSRWPDLAVRGKLIERVQAFNPDASAKIKAFHALRPIPKSQLDAISDSVKTIYQNPGY